MLEMLKNLEKTDKILLAVCVCLVLYLLYSKKENWTELNGGNQSWVELPRSQHVCDTDYDDQRCKYDAFNCSKQNGNLISSN